MNAIADFLAGTGRLLMLAGFVLGYPLVLVARYGRPKAEVPYTSIEEGAGILWIILLTITLVGNIGWIFGSIHLYNSYPDAGP